MSDLCANLFELGLISKQNVRRGLVRLCAHFEELVELDNPRGAEHLVDIMTILSKKNLISAKTLSVLVPSDFVKAKLVKTGEAREKLGKVLGESLSVLLDQEEEFDNYLKQVLSGKSEETKKYTNKYSVFNWRLIREILIIALEQGDSVSSEKAVAQLYTGTIADSFTQADFGYAIDSIIWDTQFLSPKYSSFFDKVSDLVCQMIE